MKRMLSMALALVMMLSVLSGCGSSSKPAAESTPAAASGEVSSAPSGEITVWMWENAKVSLDSLADSFAKQYPDVTVKYETMPNDDLYSKYVLAAQTGEGLPDVVIIESERLPMMIKTCSLLNVADYMGEDANKFNAGKIQMATGKDGGIYAVPWDSAPSAMMYNRKIFKNAGLSDDPAEVAKMLATWDSYKETMAQINEKTGCYAYATQSTNIRSSHFVGMMAQKAATEDEFVFTKDGNVGFDSEFGVRVAQFMADMYHEGLVYDAARYTQQHDQAYRDDKVATIFGAAWLMPILKEAYGADREGNWGVVPMPVWDEGDAPTCEDGGSNLAITANCKNVDAAWAYVSFHMMNTESQLEMYRNGLFPAWEPAYGDPSVSAEDPFFGGQNAVAVFEELAGKVPAVNYTEDFYRASEAIKVAQELTYNDSSKTVAEFMKVSADEVRAKTHRK